MELSPLYIAELLLKKTPLQNLFISISPFGYGLAFVFWNVSLAERDDQTFSYKFLCTDQNSRSWGSHHHPINTGVSPFVWRSYCAVQLALCQNHVIQNVHLWLIRHLNVILKGLGSIWETSNGIFLGYQKFPPYYSPMKPILAQAPSTFSVASWVLILADAIKACSSLNVLLGSFVISWRSCCWVLGRNFGRLTTTGKILYGS